jgi:hypothetical protein
VCRNPCGWILASIVDSAWLNRGSATAHRPGDREPRCLLQMHTIRLRGPWQVEPVARFVLQPDGTYKPVEDGLPAAGRMTMPADWSGLLGADFLGRVRYRRTFQKPTGLESGQRVWLVVEAARSRGVVELNRKRLGEAGGRFDLTDQLEDHNRLEIVVEHPALDARGMPDDDSDTRSIGGLLGEVRLEIGEIEK